MTLRRAAVPMFCALSLLLGTRAVDAMGTNLVSPPEDPGAVGAPTAATKHSCNGAVRCFAQPRLDTKGQAFASPNGPYAGFAPNDIQAAYNIDTDRGEGITVGIVDAFDDPNAESDLAVYRAYYGLPACTTANGCFRKVNQNGNSGDMPGPSPSDDDDWSVEVALDLDAVSAACPKCKILLVEAEDDFGIEYTYNLSLVLAQSTAVRLGATVISNSWGSPEYPGLALADATYFNHPGVAIFASAGDDGYLAAWPASSPNVIAVGGTSLWPDSSARGFHETVWAGTGSGCSAYEHQPAWQDTSKTHCGNRAINDVAAVADPGTGLAIYDTANGNRGWMVVGGTSLASPVTAAIFASSGNGSESSKFIYDHANKFHDVTVGNNGTCPEGIWCNAGEGWDGPTGVGTPDHAALVSLASTTTAPTKGGGGCNLGDIWSGITQLACFVPMQLWRGRRKRKTAA